MKCNKCGKVLRKNQAVCPACGAARPEEAPAQVSLRQASGKAKLTKKQLWTRIGIIAGAVVAAIAVAVVSIVAALLGRLQQASELSGSTGINSDIQFNTNVTNIALFGLDSRQNNDVGRSDAMIILSIDREHSKIKLTSLARDSYVKVDGHGSTKLTHAWAYGKASLAVRTINQNYGMNITDYAYVNFYEFVELIDYIGGVDIELNADELRVANEYYAPELNRLGITCPQIPGTGLQRLTGAQALAYARNRYTGSDIDRGNRQKNVLEAAFARVKETPVTKLPGLIARVLDMTHTNMTSGELLEIGTWALTRSPSFEKLSLPTQACKPQGGNWGDGAGWVYRYDLDIATAVLHDFIYETDTDLSTLSTTTVTRRTTLTTAATTTTTKTGGGNTSSTTTTTTNSAASSDTTSTTAPVGGELTTDSGEAEPTTTTSETDATTTTTTRAEGGEPAEGAE